MLEQEIRVTSYQQIQKYQLIYLNCGYVPDSKDPRVSQDIQVNTLGKYLLIHCRLRIVNGRHKGDPKGKFTCYTARGCSGVDYVILSSDLFSKVTDVHVGDLPTFLIIVH